MITADMKSKFDAIVSRYPADQKQSAVIPLLHLMQESNGGMLTQAHQQAVADFLSVPMSKVHEVTTFYTMYSLEKRGQKHISVCGTLPCALKGCDNIVDALSHELGVGPGEVTKDGKFSFEVVECLAQCHLGPMLQLGDAVHGNLTPEKVKAFIAEEGKKP